MGEHSSRTKDLKKKKKSLPLLTSCQKPPLFPLVALAMLGGKRLLPQLWAGEFYSVAREPELKFHSETMEEEKAHGNTVGSRHLGTELFMEEIGNQSTIHFPVNPICPRKKSSNST